MSSVNIEINENQIVLIESVRRGLKGIKGDKGDIGNAEWANILGKPIIYSPSSVAIGGQTWAIYSKGSPHNTNIKCGKIWDASGAIGTNQFVEIMLKALATSVGTYFGADNDGGDHAGLLIGIDSAGFVTGNSNIDSGSGPVPINYGSGIPIAFDDLGVLARSHTDRSITVYWKGVQIGIKEFAVGVRKFTANTANCNLHWFGTDHQGAEGYIVYGRIMEGATPLNSNINIYPPSRNAAHNSTVPLNSSTMLEFNGNWDFTNPFNTQVVPDLSAGLQVYAGQGKATHPGYFSDSVSNVYFQSIDAEYTNEKCEYRQILFGQKPFTKTIPTPPPNAIVYDSHTRADSTLQWGKTISSGPGELGGAWITASGLNNIHGIISEHLYLAQVYEPVYKNVPTANFEVTFTRANSVYLRHSAHYETYIPKLIDTDNMLAFTVDPYGQGYLIDANTRYGPGGTIVGAVFYPVPLNFTSIKFSMSGSEIEVFVDGVTKGKRTIPSRFLTATKTGIMETGDCFRKLKSILVKAV